MDTGDWNKHHETALILFVLCLGLYLVPYRIMGGDLAFIPGSLGDARFNNYILEHGFRWLTGREGSFWNAPFFYPAQNVIAFSDNFLGTLPFYSIFRVLGLDRETSFQGWFFVVFSLNYLSCVWVLRKFSISLTGAVAGAFIFAFSLPVVSNLIHCQLLPVFMVPPALYFLWSYLKKPDLKPFTGLCFSVVLQMYCTIYIGVFLFFALAAFTLSYAVLHHERIVWREILWGSGRRAIASAAILITACLLLLPLALPYIKCSQEYGLRSWGEIEKMLPRPESYKSTISGSLVWGSLSRFGRGLPVPWEHNLFIGALPWIGVFVAMAGVGRKNRDNVTELGLISVFSLLFLMVVTLYWNGFTLYKIIVLIPGVRSIRAISRIVMVLAFFYAVAVGVLFTRFENIRFIKEHRGVRWLSLSILFVLLVVDQSAMPVSYSKVESRMRADRIAELVLQKGAGAKVFAYVPPKSKEDDSWVHIDAMLASQQANIPTVNGFSGVFPINYDFFRNYNQAWALDKWVAYSNIMDDDRAGLFDGLVLVGGPLLGQAAVPEQYSIAYGALPDDAFKAEIVTSLKAVTVRPNEIMKLHVMVINRSNENWPSLAADHSGRNYIVLGCRWLSQNSRQVKGNILLSPLLYDLRPGQYFVLNVELQGPGERATYTLAFDMIQQQVTWFEDKGSKPAYVTVDIK